jgi:hypothetical protein
MALLKKKTVAPQEQAPKQIDDRFITTKRVLVAAGTVLTLAVALTACGETDADQAPAFPTTTAKPEEEATSGLRVYDGNVGSPYVTTSSGPGESAEDRRQNGSFQDGQPFNGECRQLGRIVSSEVGYQLPGVPATETEGLIDTVTASREFVRAPKPYDDPADPYYFMSTLYLAGSDDVAALPNCFELDADLRTVLEQSPDKQFALAS